MWFHVISRLKTLSASKIVRIIYDNELSNFLSGKEQKTTNQNEKRNKELPATVFF